ncbi:MAG: hypothetical protein Rubg2KO_12530 [Rubricoccaceae bacterium]
MDSTRTVLSTSRAAFVDRETGERYHRIYHLHVRKTAGTSLNTALARIGNLGEESRLRGRGRLMLKGVAPKAPHHLVIVRHDPELLDAGHYHLGYSHKALWQLDLPPSTFRLTVLRDPVRRLASYYRYLLWTRRESRRNPERLRRLEGSWRDLLIEAEAMGKVGQESIVTLAEMAPPQHVSTQLWMFSEALDPLEAARNVLTCHAIFRTETFGDDVRQLAERLNLPLQSCRERAYETASLPAPTPDELDHVRSILAPEYEMLAHVDRLQNA